MDYGCGDGKLSALISLHSQSVLGVDPSKSMLVVAGKRYSGTRAAIVAFLKHFTQIQTGNIHNSKIAAKIVEGVDLDSDGIVDDAEIRE